MLFEIFWGFFWKIYQILGQNCCFLTKQKPVGFRRVSQSGSGGFGSHFESRVRVWVSLKQSGVGFQAGFSKPGASLFKNTFTEDGARLVLWYKDSNPQPVYSFDARFLKPKHWSQDPNFGSRSFFRQGSDQAPAQLIVSGVTMKDAGTYKCRVDFKMSQTVTHVIELK